MESRKRLKPWLKRKVEDGEFGLQWIDRNEQVFSIPWMHRSNKSWNKANFQIFKEWAIFTGKYREGQPEDWPGWKTRLRTALTKLPDFMEMPDLHQLENGDNPYKVYKFISLRDNIDSSSSTGGSPGSSQLLDGSPCSSQPTGCSPWSTQSSPYFDALASPQCDRIDEDSPNINDRATYFVAGNIPTTVELSGETLLQYNQQPVDQHLDFNIPVSSQSESICVAGQQVNANDTGSLMDVGSLPSDLLNLDSGDLVSRTKFNSEEMKMYEKKPVAEYKIYYLNEVVKVGTLFEDGALFYFGHIPDFDLPDNVFGPKHVEKIQFPDITNIERSINSELIRHIQDILLNMNRGFLLQHHEGIIWARRLCRTRIFASNHVTGNMLLDRASKQNTMLFDSKVFAKQCLEKKTKPSVILTFAQELKLDTFKNLLVHVELSPIIEDKGILPSSPKTSLQYSGFDSGDQLLHMLSHLSVNDKTAV